MLRELLERCRRTAEAAWFGAAGRLRYRLGGKRGLRGAREAFERLVALDPGSYTGHLHLGLIALHLGQRNAAVSEFSICYRLSSKRFRRARLPDDLKERILWGERMLDELGLRWVGPNALAEWTHENQGTHTVRQSAPRRGSPGVGVHPTSGVLSRTDFASVSEYRRLRPLPPITAEDLAAVDIDELVRRLTDAD